MLISSAEPKVVIVYEKAVYGYCKQPTASLKRKFTYLYIYYHNLIVKY